MYGGIAITFHNNDMMHDAMRDTDTIVVALMHASNCFRLPFTIKDYPVVVSQ